MQIKIIPSNKAAIKKVKFETAMSTTDCLLVRYKASDLPKQTPWIDWKEWERVKNYVFGNIQEQREAALWINLWRSRGNCPAAVESTGNFLELAITLHDSRTVPHLSNTMIRHLISMALIRFVNGIVDQAQRAQFAVSVSNILSYLVCLEL